MDYIKWGIFGSSDVEPSPKKRRSLKSKKKSSSKKKASIPKKIKQLVWNTYMGESNGTGLCQCCQSTKISQMEFHCGHIISEASGGQITVDNLKPICALCNTSMGSRNMDEYMLTHGFIRRGWCILL